jgi:hypothetical protein
MARKRQNFLSHESIRVLSMRVAKVSTFLTICVFERVCVFIPDTRVGQTRDKVFSLARVVVSRRRRVFICRENCVEVYRDQESGMRPPGS